MNEYMTEEEIKELAAQLRCPTEDEICELMEDSNSFMISETLKKLSLGVGDVVMELGPGNGHHLKSILKTAKEAFIVDISDYTISAIGERYSESVLEGKLKTILTDGVSIDIESGIVDKGFTVNTIYFWQDPVSYLNEIGKVFKNDGEFFITFAHQDSVKDLPFVKYGFELYNEEKLQKLCEGSCFSVSELLLKTEKISSKIGEELQRDFVIAKLIKSS